MGTPLFSRITALLNLIKTFVKPSYVNNFKYLSFAGDTQKFTNLKTSFEACSKCSSGVSILGGIKHQFTNSIFSATRVGNVGLLQLSNLFSVNSRGISTSKGVSDIQSRISSLKSKKRAQKKRKAAIDHSDEEFKICAVGTADEYDLDALSEAFNKQGLYIETPVTKRSNQSSPSVKSADKDLLDSNEVLHLTAAYQVGPEPREMYVFREGAVVFWNISPLERENALKFIQSYQIGHYSEEIVNEESETLSYAYTEGNTRLKPSLNRVLLNENGDVELEKFTASNALAMSVKLGLWEASLDKYVENIEYVTEELSKTGKVVLSQESVLQHMGQLFALRHLINLSSDLLDTPDFYWEHEHLEQIYNRVSSHLNIQKRTGVMNEKLGHCLELMELLKSHLSEKHSSRLEWIIIILIMVEVFFEILHYV